MARTRGLILIKGFQSNPIPLFTYYVTQSLYGWVTLIKLTMKRFYFLLGCFLCLWGCNKTPIIDDNHDNPSEGEEVLVSLGLGGEITISETPLSRAAGSETSSKDLYGINVYYDKDKDGKIDDYYAYGLFDNVADMVITLVTGHKYKFECRMVVDGKERCKKGYNTGDYYGNPFKTATSLSGETYGYGSSDYQRCSNHFISGTNHFLDNCFKKGNTEKEGFLADTYYGEASGYSPKENGVVNINMKRCVYGLSINVSGLAKGTAKISVNYYSGKDDDLGINVNTSSGLSIYGISFTEDNVYSYDIVSFGEIYDCWSKAISQEVYSVIIPIKIYWEYTYEGTSVKETFTKYKAVTLKRNVMTTVDIKLNIDTNSQFDSRFSMSMDSSEMTTENSNFNFDIKLDGTTNNPVNPT